MIQEVCDVRWLVFQHGLLLGTVCPAMTPNAYTSFSFLFGFHSGPWLALPCSDVKAIDGEDKQDLAAFPFDEAAEFAGLGDAQPVGEKGFTTLERRYSNPCACLFWLANVQGQRANLVCKLQCCQMLMKHCRRQVSVAVCPVCLKRKDKTTLLSVIKEKLRISPSFSVALYVCSYVVFACLPICQSFCPATGLPIVPAFTSLSGILTGLNIKHTCLHSCIAVLVPLAEQHLASVGFSICNGERVLIRWLRPTLDVVGIYGGFQGVGIKTIVPSKATAKISCRLVPNQSPDKIIQVRPLCFHPAFISRILLSVSKPTKALHSTSCCFRVLCQPTKALHSMSCWFGFCSSLQSLTRVRTHVYRLNAHV